MTTSSSSDGKTHVENLNTDGYKSAISLIIYDPRPLPVPPPRECKKKKPCKLSHLSTDCLTFSSISSLYMGPYSRWPRAQLLPAPDWSDTHYLASNMSFSSPFRILLLMTPDSISTTIALAFKSVIYDPTGRSFEYVLFFVSTFLKKLLIASSYISDLLYSACSFKASSQNFRPI